MPIKLSAAIAAVGLCLIVAGVARAAETSVYWRLDLHQGAYIIAHGQGSTEQAAWDDCIRLKKITRAMTAAETRRNAVAAITAPTVRWCQNPKRYGTISPDPVVPPPPPPPVDCVVSAWGPWSDPPWLACASGQQTRALVRTRTIVTQPANGGAACPELVETRTETRPCPGIATLSWTPPTHYTNGDRLTDIRNYKVIYGPSQAGLSDCMGSIGCRTVETVAGAPSSFTLTGLTPGTWYFAVRVVTASGTESVNSNVVSKIVQ